MKKKVDMGKLMEACDKARERVSSYTPEQRAALLKKAHEIMDKAQKQRDRKNRVKTRLKTI